jgi:hypothetical protein
MSRKIEQYPDKAIRPILLSIVESLENDGVYLEDISEDYENEFQQSYPIIKSELESYGLENEFEDITYIMYIFVNNPNFTTEPIKRPELKKYEVLHIVDRTINVQDTYLNNFNSYIPLTKSILIDMQSDSLYEPYDGEEINSEHIDSDWNDDWIDQINEV